MIPPGNNRLTSVNKKPIIQLKRRLTQRLLSASFPFFCPIYCEICIPAIAVTAPITTEYKKANFPAIPTAAMLVLPSCPTMT